MFGLKGRQDGFRILLPKDFIAPELEEKYTRVLTSKNGFFNRPIDFLNETIKKVQILGINNGVFSDQHQPSIGHPIIDPDRVDQNKFLHSASEFQYRSSVSPLELVDKTLNIYFRHTLGYLNYFLIFENFWYQYARDRKYNEMANSFNIDIFNERGVIYSRIVLQDPIMNGMDMLDFDYTQPIAQSQEFKVEFKYSNFDFQFLTIDNFDEHSLITGYNE